MWAVRRASISVRSHAPNKQTMRAFGGITEVSGYCIEEKAESVEHSQVKSERSSEPVKNLYRSPHNSPKSLIMGRRFLSSQAGEESSDEDLDDDVMSGKDVEAVLSDNDDEVEEQEELLDTEINASEKKATRNLDYLPLFRKIVAASGVTVSKVMDQWVEEGHDVGREDIMPVMYGLRKRKMFGRALQLSEWAELTNRFEFTERDYASRVDLTSKARGIHVAESYLTTKVPQEFRTEVTYRTLLANCVTAGKEKKAEEVFNKMKDLGFPLSVFACNQLFLMYKRVDKRKIADVLLLMEKEDLKPNLFTYKILIDTKGASRDIEGMEQIMASMSNEGVEPDALVYAVIAKHYIYSGLKEKAEAILKKMEGSNIRENHTAVRSALPLYAAIGKSEDVSRIWNLCKSDHPKMDEYLAAIEAFGKLKKIEDAEEVFDQMSKHGPKLSSKHYTTLVRAYANCNMLAKGIDIIKKMDDNGCVIGPLAWDALIKLYVDAGEVEKADEILEKASQKNKFRPMYNSFISIMSKYAKRGDIHNAEKLFLRMKQSGYEARSRQFHTLLEAYVKAGKPAYGIRDRMRADNVFPQKSMAGLLASVDAFRKKAIDEILE